MSKTLTLVGSSPLASFATSLVSKATKNAVKAATGAVTANAVVLGSDMPAGVHTAIASSKGAGPYAGVKTTVVRAVLPKKSEDDLALRDVLDVLRGADLSNEVKEITAAFQKSAQEAISAAKAAKATKVVLMLKQQSAHEETNALFTQVAKEAIEAAGLSVEISTTAQVTNQLLMFPEDVPVVFTNDNPTTENVEKAFAGVTGGAPITLKTDAGTAFAAYSPISTAAAVAESLASMGYKTEAAAVEKALGNAKLEKNGEDILSAL